MKSTQFKLGAQGIPSYKINVTPLIIKDNL